MMKEAEMMTKMRWLACAALLVAAVACEQSRSPVQPDAAPSFNHNGPGTDGSNTVGDDSMHTGYFGSGHYEPPPPPPPPDSAIAVD